MLSISGNGKSEGRAGPGKALAVDGELLWKRKILFQFFYCSLKKERKKKKHQLDITL